MRSPLSSIWMVVCAAWIWQINCVSAIFLITYPQNGSVLQNNVGIAVTWWKGLEDDIFGFDLELTRMSQDGLYLAARNVPAPPGVVNLYLEEVPAGDDYFLLFINSTIGQMYALSSTFSIVAADSSTSVVPTSPSNNQPTITISGTPIPTPLFGTTFATLPSGAVDLFSSNQINALLLSLLCCAFGASLTIGW